jgi:hypothetical protein
MFANSVVACDILKPNSTDNALSEFGQDNIPELLIAHDYGNRVLRCVNCVAGVFPQYKEVPPAQVEDVLPGFTAPNHGRVLEASTDANDKCSAIILGNDGEVVSDGGQPPVLSVNHEPSFLYVRGTNGYTPVQLTNDPAGTSGIVQENLRVFSAHIANLDDSTGRMDVLLGTDMGVRVIRECVDSNPADGVCDANQEGPPNAILNISGINYDQVGPNKDVCSDGIASNDHFACIFGPHPNPRNAVRAADLDYAGDMLEITASRGPNDGAGSKGNLFIAADKE